MKGSCLGWCCCCCWGWGWRSLFSTLLLLPGPKWWPQWTERKQQQQQQQHNKSSKSSKRVVCFGVAVCLCACVSAWAQCGPPHSCPHPSAQTAFWSANADFVSPALLLKHHCYSALLGTFHLMAVSICWCWQLKQHNFRCLCGQCLCVCVCLCAPPAVAITA